MAQSESFDSFSMRLSTFSTAPELIMRACFLMDLQDYSKTTKQGDFKDAADKKGVSEELKQIKAALQDRGFDKEELSNLGLGK